MSESGIMRTFILWQGRRWLPVHFLIRLGTGSFSCRLTFGLKSSCSSSLHDFCNNNLLLFSSQSPQLQTIYFYPDYFDRSFYTWRTYSMGGGSFIENDVLRDGLSWPCSTQEENLTNQRADISMFHLLLEEKVGLSWEGNKNKYDRPILMAATGDPDL